MADRAQVRSVGAIEAFRAKLIVYLSKARPTLEEISTELQRTRQWLQNDHRRVWESELKQRRKKLERAQNELFSANLSTLQEASALQYLAVRRAQEAVREAEAKLVLLQKWDRELENRSEPLMKQVDAMHHILTTDFPKAIAFLDRTITTLEAYADVPRPGVSTEAAARASAAGQSADASPAGDSPSAPEESE